MSIDSDGINDVIAKFKRSLPQTFELIQDDGDRKRISLPEIFVL